MRFGRCGDGSIESTPFYSSAEGLPIYHDHDYNLVSVYNNTTSSDQDAMAMMYVYMKGNQFRRPEACGKIWPASARPSEPANTYSRCGAAPIRVFTINRSRPPRLVGAVAFTMAGFATAS